MRIVSYHKVMSALGHNLEHIPSFHAVMVHGSLSGAARKLHLAQPTVRRHIEALEADLGARLFTRSANGLTPTALARTLLPMAQAVLEEAQALKRVASAQVGALEGVVRITCSRMVAGHILPPVLAQLRQKAPQITFEVAATDRSQNLARRAADIAIRFAPPTQQALVALKLPPVEIGLFAAEPMPDADLQDMPFVADDREDLLLPAMAQAGIAPPRNIVLRCDDPFAQLAHVQAGVGVGICQVKLAARLGLTRVMPQVKHSMPAWLVVHEDQSKIARIRLTLDHLNLRLPVVM